MKSLLKRNVSLVITSAGIIGGLVLMQTEVAYDSPGLPGLLYWLVQLATILCWGVGEVLDPPTWLAIVLGLGIACGLDYLVNLIRRWRSRRPEKQETS